MNQDQDPRKGLPSASNAEADALCPGRHLMQQGLPDPGGDDARRGIDMHEALRGVARDLSDQEAVTVALAKCIEEEMLDWWMGDQLREDIVCHREVRWWSDPTGLQPLCSGQADAVWICGGRALIEDLKSLYGDVQHSSRNMQLRDLAALVYVNEGVREVSVYINQPALVRHPQPTVYGPEDLKRAYGEMTRRAMRSLDPDAPRIPGPVQCRHCRAKAVCPEALAEIPKTKEAMTNEVTKTPTKIDAKEIAAKLPGDQLANYLEQYELVKMIGKACEEEAKRRLEKDPDAVPGYLLKPGAKRWELPASHRVAEAFSGFIPSDQFWQACCEPSKGLIQQYLELVLGYSANGAKRMVDTRLEQIAEKKQNAPSLARKKEEK